MQDLINACETAIHQIEQRLERCYDDASIATATAVLVEEIGTVCRIRLRILFGSNATWLVQHGVLGDSVDAVSASSGLTQNTQLELIADLRRDQESDASAVATVLQETVEAAVALLAAAFAKNQLSSCDRILEKVIAIARDSTQSPQDRHHEIASFIAREMGADRISLVQRRGTRAKLLATSVRGDFDRRSEFAGAAEKLGRSTHLSVDSLNQDDANEYADEFRAATGAAHVTLHPLHHSNMIVIAEWTAAESIDAQTLSGREGQLIDFALAHVNAVAQVSFASRLRQSASRQPKSFYAAMAAAFILLIALPVPFSVLADGRIVPRVQHRVFASVNGSIKEISVQAGQPVRSGDVLCEFESAELTLREAELIGELATTQEKLQVALSRRGDGEIGELSADRNVLRTRAAKLQHQIDIVRAQRKKLVVRSPIDGRIEIDVQDDLGAIVRGRPVKIGQPILRVISPEKGYRVEFEIADRDSGYVVRTQQRTKNQACRYRIRSAPSREYQASIDRIESAARRNALGQRVVRAHTEFVDVHATVTADAGVSGWIRCGYAPTGFVMFRRVIETARLYLL